MQFISVTNRYITLLRLKIGKEKHEGGITLVITVMQFS